MSPFKLSSWIAVLGALPVGSSTAWAGDVFVQADAHGGGNGGLFRPYNSLAQVEAGSGPGDTIFVLPSQGVLDGGLQLKDGQSLIGLGTQIAEHFPNFPHAQLTNSSGAHLSGDAVRLANNNKVLNVHINRAFRGGILGINVANPVIEANLITDNMNQHSVQDLQENFVFFQPQRNQYGAITLFACGAATHSECTDEDPTTPGIASHHATISGNVINNVLASAIIILNDTGVAANYDITHNSVDGVSLQYPGFNRNDLLPPLVPEVVRSRAFTILVGNSAHSYVNMDHFDATHLAPPGDWASDGTVFVTFGTGAVISADLRHVSVTNPDFTGEIVNGDSLEMTTFGSNATFDIRVRDSVFRDSVSTLTKMLEVGVTNGNSYFVDMQDVELTNVNPRVAVGASLGAIAYQKIPARGATSTVTIDIKLKNVLATGHRRGLFVQNLNNVHMTTLNLSAEGSTFSNATNEGFRLFNQGGVIDNFACDLGGGTLGSSGHNTFLNNGTAADADATIINLGAQELSCAASQNYWGGGAPVTGVGQNLFTSGPADFVVNSYLTHNPNH